MYKQTNKRTAGNRHGISPTFQRTDFLDEFLENVTRVHPYTPPRRPHMQNHVLRGETCKRFRVQPHASTVPSSLAPATPGTRIYLAAATPFCACIKSACPVYRFIVVYVSWRLARSLVSSIDIGFFGGRAL